MEIKITKDETNSTTGRREVQVYVLQDDKTPSKEDIKKEVCKKLSLGPDLTVVVKVDQKFGTKQSIATLHAYKDQASLNAYTQKYLIGRATGEKRKGAAPAEKKEEKKEEKAEAKAGEKKE